MAQIGKKYFQMRVFFTFSIKYCQFDNRCQHRLLSQNNSPLPHSFFHFAPLSRVVTSHWARAIAFLIICSHFDHDGLENSARGHSVYLQRRGKTRNEMVIPKDLKSFLQALSV